MYIYLLLFLLFSYKFSKQGLMIIFVKDYVYGLTSIYFNKIGLLKYYVSSEVTELSLFDFILSLS